MTDLLPCPFCGSANAHSIGDTIMCDGCEAMGPNGLNDDEARARWNTRATPKPKRDPLTDPRPGDVVRYTAPDIHGHITARVTARDRFYVWAASEHGENRYTIEHWSDWSDITTEVLHTADEVTP